MLFMHKGINIALNLNAFNVAQTLTLTFNAAQTLTIIILQWSLNASFDIICICTITTIKLN
jgi:hypothetical protein